MSKLLPMLIGDIGLLVLQAACAQSRAWCDQRQAIRISVNRSARQFIKDDLSAVIDATLRDSGADPHLITLELTASTVMHDADRVADVLRDIKVSSVKVSIDDFGAGCSSLANRKRLPIDPLKIDRSFVRDIISDPSDAAITQAIIAMARSMDLAVIAEGVETVEQWDFLRACDCHEIQGYYLSQALPAGASSDWMRANQASERGARVAGDALAPTAGPPDRRPRLH